MVASKFWCLAKLAGANKNDGQVQAPSSCCCYGTMMEGGWLAQQEPPAPAASLASPQEPGRVSSRAPNQHATPGMPPGGLQVSGENSDLGLQPPPAMKSWRRAWTTQTTARLLSLRHTCLSNAPRGACHVSHASASRRTASAARLQEWHLVFVHLPREMTAICQALGPVTPMDTLISRKSRSISKRHPFPAPLQPEI
jgi:hypothetical protein